jgi:hypothetical protein
MVTVMSARRAAKVAMTANRAAAEADANRPPVELVSSAYPIGAGELTRTSMVRDRRAAGEEVFMLA